MIASRMLSAAAMRRSLAAVCPCQELHVGRMQRQALLPSRGSVAWAANAPTNGIAARSRNVSTSVVAHKSKRSFAASVDDPSVYEDNNEGDVPVMKKKGKGAKAAKASPKGTKTKRGNQEAEEKHDSSRYPTSTRNQELPDEQFDSAALTENMKRAVERCRSTVSQKVGMIGRVDPALLDGVKVMIGKGPETFPLSEVASVGARNGALYIHPYDPDYVKDIEKAIYTSQLNLTPQVASGDDEGALRVPIPRPTIEARKDLIKELSKLCENARISIRSTRHTAQKQIKADMDSKTVSSSEGKTEMKKMEDTTKKYSTEIDDLYEEMRKKVEATMQE